MHKTIITYGTYDALHWGHINLLQRAKKLGDKLIVGVSTDKFNAQKGKDALFSFEERVNLLKSTGLADEIIPEKDWSQKAEDINKYQVNTLVMGDDWEGKFDDLPCEVVYLKRTELISTSEVKKRAKLGNVTAIINNFLRMPYTKKCVESLRANYPQVKILIGNSDKPSLELEEFAQKHKCEYMELPFDCGITVTRNLMLKKVKTDYILVGDDDFYYGQEANLDKMVKLMDIADVCGGRVRENEIRNYQAFMDIIDNSLIYTPLVLENFDEHKGVKYKKCDLTFNFFIAKKNIPPWDEKIKISYEHSDYFLTLKQCGYKVVFTPDAIVDHKPFVDGLDLSTYAIFRDRKYDKEYFFKKWFIERAVDIHGRESFL
jgi:glycerol-3-phosphate cytidylyltransferase